MKNKNKDQEYSPIQLPSIGTIIFSFIVALLLINSVAVIQTGTVGVLMQFGEMKDILRPGVHVIIPLISSIEVLSTQTMKYQVDASAASSDLQVVSTNIAVNYRLSDSDEGLMYAFRQFRGAHEDRIIMPLVQESVKANTAKFTADDLIQRREFVKAAITNTLEDKLLDYGIIVDEVSITNFDFSKQFNDAIEAKVVIEQQKAQAQLELEKKEIDVKKLVVEQNASATAQIIQAEADRQSSILRAEGESQAILLRAEANKQSIEKINSVLSEGYVRYEYAKNWDGALPYLMGGDSGFLMQLGIQNRS